MGWREACKDSLNAPAVILRAVEASLERASKKGLGLKEEEEEEEEEKKAAFFSALALCRDFLSAVHADILAPFEQGPTVVDAQALQRMDDEEFAEGGRPSTAVARRTAVSSILATLSPLAPLCALLLAPSTTEAAQEPASPLATLCSSVLWGLVRTGPLQIGFSLLEQSSQLCDALCPTFITKAVLAAAAEEAPLSFLVSAVACGRGAEGMAAQLCLQAIVSASDDALNFCRGCPHWDSAKAFLS